MRRYLPVAAWLLAVGVFVAVAITLYPKLTGPEHTRFEESVRAAMVAKLHTDVEVECGTAGPISEPTSCQATWDGRSHRVLVTPLPSGGAIRITW